MLRPSILRKIGRVRAVRQAVRTYYHPIQQYAPSHLNSGNVLPVTQPAARLYQPDVEVEEDGLAAEEDEDSTPKARLTQIAEDDSPEMDEQALRDFYTALVASAVEDAPAFDLPRLEGPTDGRMTREQRLQLLQGLESRLRSSGIVGSALDTKVAVTREQGDRATRLAAALAQISVPSSSRQSFSLKGKEKADARPADLPVGLVSKKEWDALFESFIVRKDTRGAESVLGLMMQHGMRPEEDHINRVMRLDAYAGRPQEISRLIAGYLSLGGDMSVIQHNAFLTSLLAGSSPQIQTALEYLREFERKGQALPQESYHLVMKHLTVPTGRFQTTSHTRAQAWELFTHMRFNAHPLPDKSIYTLMIRTCGDARDPQPERARDLWLEMTQEGDKIKPTRVEYDAVIRALCATKDNYLEAFDMLREMLARHQDAVMVPFEDAPRQLWSAYVPTLETFTALLEGTKRAGDIERARWILSELIGLVGSSIEVGQPMQGPEEELLSSIFMTYAAWKPRISRRGVKTKSPTSEVDTRLEAGNLDRLTEIEVDTTEETSRSTSNAPRTSADAIREATAIFERVLQDAKAKQRGEKNFFAHPFIGATLRTRLVNSYLSIHLEHAATSEAMYQTWSETWTRVAEIDPTVKPNGWSYMMLLERCASGRRKEETALDKAFAASWGKRVWKQYIDWLASSPVETIEPSTATAVAKKRQSPPPVDRRKEWLSGLGPRQIERCWKSAIKLYALTNHTTTSLALLQEFRRRYPAEQVQEGYDPYKVFGMATRIMDLTKMSEPDVPPHLLFADVDVLHQRLVRKDDHTGIARLKFITKEYEHSLLKRQSFRRKNVGVKRELDKYKAEVALVEEETKKSISIHPPAEDEDMEDEWDEFIIERRQAWA